MKIEYWPDVDMLHINLGVRPDEYEGGQDAGDPDIVIHFDKHNRLVELEVSNASERVNLDRLRSSPIFVEVDPERDAAKEEALKRIKEIAEEADISLEELAIGSYSPTYHSDNKVDRYRRRIAALRRDKSRRSTTESRG